MSRSTAAGHLVDVALACSRAKREFRPPPVRRSAGYLSIMTRLGAAIEAEGLHAEAALRASRITYPMIRASVRSDRTSTQVVQQLLAASRTHKDRRRVRPRSRSSALEAQAYAFRYDDRAMAEDPQAVVRALQAHLGRLGGEVVPRLRSALFRHARSTGERSAAGMSLPMLNARLQSSRADSRDEERERLEHVLREILTLVARASEVGIARREVPKPAPRTVTSAPEIPLDEILADFETGEGD